MTNTALGAATEKDAKIIFISEAHEKFYYEKLILMYRDIGEYISKQSENTGYGVAFAQELADFFAANYPDLKGFTAADFTE